MKKFSAALTTLSLLTIVTIAQKKAKPWTEWSEKETLKMLNDSPWGQTQADTNTSEMFYSPTSQGRIGSRPLDTSGDRNSQGAYNQSAVLNYHIRFLTARPMRQAIARRAQMANPQLSEQLAAFAEQKSDQYIVVAVDYDSSDRRMSGNALQLFGGLNTGALKNGTYLELRSGKRVFLQQYMSPIADGMGAKFVFPRLVDGQPFITEDAGYVRFYSEISKTFKLDMRFKTKDMLYDGNLEY
jgi:hypothetical protein